MSSATRGSVRRRWRKASRDAGSLTGLAVHALHDVAVLEAEAAEDAVVLDLEEAEAGRAAVRHLGDGAQLGHEPAHVVGRASASSRRSTMKASAPVRRMRSGAGAAASSAAVRRGLGRARRSPGGASSSVASTPSRCSVTRSQAIAVMRAPRIVSPDAVELLAVRLDVLDHGMAARAVQADAPQPEPVGESPRRRSGAD